ncbi:hypothetical protein HDV05_006761 [Chytridiales sp. JEL 0842]|nr:hypothetical protein HDV05_006761 [Chytridiales sp. JEL 0842]
MTKKTSSDKPKAATAAMPAASDAKQAPPKKKSVSEIDDIFSLGSKKRSADADDQTPSKPSKESNIKPKTIANKNSAKKQKTTNVDESKSKDSDHESQKSDKKKSKAEKDSESSIPMKKASKAAVETVDFSSTKTSTKQQPPPPPDDDGFANSRGSTSKKTTEDGLPVYYMEDLKVGQGAGGTY